jgi:hypothetical protein
VATEQRRPIKLEPVKRAQVAILYQAMGMGRLIMPPLNDLDLELGRGVFGSRDHCLWAKDGRRVEINTDNGGVIASVTKDPDPNYPNIKLQSDPA